MWIIIGFIIIIYAVIALIVLYKWRNNILKFVLEIFTDTDEVLKEAETILPPIQDTASDVRQIAESIHGVGDEIIRVIPPALESIAEEMGNLNASIQDFEREAGGQLDDLGETIRESLNNLIELLNDQSTTSIPAVTDLLRTVSLQIDELEWYKLTSSVVEQLNDDFSIPTSVTDKLSDLIDLEYPNRESFIQALDQRLEDAESQAYNVIIADTSRNPDFENDFAGIIESLGEAIFKAGKEAMPSLADSMEDFSPAWVAATSVLFGPFAPLALIVISASNAFLLLKNVINTIPSPFRQDCLHG